MQVLVLLLFWLLIFFSICYVLIILTFTIGWFRIKYFKGSTVGELPNISLVIAVRNEQNNIEKLLGVLTKQNFPKRRLEIVIVNDHSEDETVEVIRRFMNDNANLEISIIQSQGEGKKSAIKNGIINAKYDLIVTTDADCSMDKNWLKRLAEYYVLNEPKLVVGAVVYGQRKGFVQQFYMLDFMSLVASGTGSLGMGLPLMANGANLLYSKQTYLDVVDDQSGKLLASGDDVFLLHAISKKFGASSVHFIKDSLTIVTTEPPDSFSDFLSQRKRWASKATAYKSWWSILVSVSVFSLNLTLVLSVLTSFTTPWFLIIFSLFILLKMLIDFPLLKYFSEFSNRKSMVPYLFLFGFIYPFYIVLAGFSSFFFRFTWKGRINIK